MTFIPFSQWAKKREAFEILSCLGNIAQVKVSADLFINILQNLCILKAGVHGGSFQIQVNFAVSITDRMTWLYYFWFCLHYNHSSHCARLISQAYAHPML